MDGVLLDDLSSWQVDLLRSEEHIGIGIVVIGLGMRVDLALNLR